MTVGIMDADDPNLRERLIGLKLRRDELAVEIIDTNRRIADGAPIITPHKLEKLTLLLRDKLYNGTPELKQAYARPIMAEVIGQNKEIRIKGSRRVLAKAASQGLKADPPAVLFFSELVRPRGIEPLFAP